MNIPEFKDKKLYEKVFVHRSFLNEATGANLESNERLEFLGDSILSFVVSAPFVKKRIGAFARALSTNPFDAFADAIAKTESARFGTPVYASE